MARKRTVETNTRIEQAIKLRASGHTYDAIASQLGYAGRQSAQKAVSRELERRISSDVNELRTLQHLVLEELIRALWKHLYTKRGSVNLRVVDRIIKCYERESRLMGYNAPLGGHQSPGVGRVEVILREASTE